MTEQTTRKADVTHVYPKMPFVLGERDAAGNVIPEPTQKPISDEREGDVWYELRELTFEDEPGCIFVATHELEKDSDDGFKSIFEKEETVTGRLRFPANLKITRDLTKEGKTRIKEEAVPWNLGIRECADEVIARCSFRRNADVEPLLALVLWQPEASTHLKYLDKVVKACPDLPIYIFHGYHIDKYGVEREGNPLGSLWDTQSACINEPDLPWVIEHIAHEGETTWLGALPKVGKTWTLLLKVKALLTGEPLFGDPRLKVPRRSKRVIYLCPEAGRGSITKRMKMLGLMGHLYDPITNPDGPLYLRSLSKGPKLELNNSKLLELVKGSDIFIDTAIRYLEGNENDSGDVKVLTENVLNLLSVGARSVWVAHHAPKGFENANTMTLQNMFRGSGEFGAALTNAYGLCTEDEATTKIRFHCITGRDLDEPIADLILVGRPYLKDNGNFFVESTNAEPFKGHNNSKSGPKDDPDRQAKIVFAKSVDGSFQEKADAVNKQFGSDHGKSTIAKWLKKDEQESSFKEHLTVAR